ncbi:hypothetical protein GCM10020258_27760 [Sphingomonas yabuuchiae]
MGQRDILLEDQGPEPVGAYTLPVDTGPRSSFGKLTTVGDTVFDLNHLNVFPRFDEGQLYDSRLTDDLRNALVATGLFNGVAVEPKRTGRMNPDGTEQIDLQVTQTKGPSRTLSGRAAIRPARACGCRAASPTATPSRPRGYHRLGHRGYAGTGLERHLPPFQCRAA